ncbi:lipid A export permease/ATP-binding protein MsbA [Aestuariibacter sp. GS-14]|uniref:lipid A export permease/ATP-binding protein MsbA n=1 Tax=Aestuariibacter sp. GS-14 TaxID=2590670 RepID=UPI00112EE821|nr:lipid A export permease/ATP-binding protein MsbA [Aestuariibacter sp. GS-14]TPV61049.1 lipid A export permease/ATP-binding protein MsbA [Aestuariibacter sp. GS-14]
MQPNSSTDLPTKRFFSYLRDYKLAFVAAFFGMVGYSAIDTFVISQVQPVIDQALNKQDFDYLRMAAYLVVPVFMLRGIFNFLGSYALSWIGSQVVMKMRQQLFAKYISLPVSYHDQQSKGNLISKVIYDTDQIAGASSKALAVLVREGALVVGILLWMFYLSWQLSLVFLFVGPVVAVVVSFVTKRFRKVSRSIQQSMGSLTSSVEQVVKGHKVVLMFGGQNKEQQRFAQKSNSNRQQNMKLAVTQTLSVSTIQVIASLALAVVLYIASTPGLLADLTAGTFVTIVFYMVMLLKPLKQLTTVNSEFQKGMAACQSIFAVLDEQPETDNGKLEAGRVSGDIRFNDVIFTYPGKSQPAINQISMHVPAGSSVALVGRSGSGKSTLSSLITRFYLPQQGSIQIDETDINAFTLASLRKNIALVSQQVTLFNDTIANNIAYGVSESVTRQQIEHAARLAHVMEFADQMEQGLDTMVGEDGASLSGGQRQRVAIARALLLDAPILILDEATSALDTESERMIQDALERLQQNRTSIIIAHRLSTIENADQILVVDQGKVVECGQHQQLLAAGGAYAQLHAMQFGE